MNSLLKRTSHALATLLLVAVSTDDLAAQKTYTTAYRFSNSDLRLRLRWITSNFVAETDNLGAQGYRMIDLNSYRDGAGTVRHDATFLPYGGAYRFYADMDEGDFVGTTNSLVSQGFQLNTFSSYALNNGTRLYAANYLESSSGGQLTIGQTRTEFLDSYAANTSLGERLAAFDTYLDTSGVRRYDSLFVPGSTEPHALATGMSQAQFESRRVTELQNGRRMWMFQTYRDSTNQLRYDAVYRDASLLNSTRLFFAETEAQMLAQRQAQAAQGFRLVEVEPTFLGTSPERNSYGTGLAGTLGRAPDLTMANPPELGQSNSLSIRANSGQPTIGVLAIGINSAQFPLLGGTLLVDPIVQEDVVLSTNLVSVPTFYPGDPVLDGVRLYYQVIVLDNGAPQGLSMSRGLEVVIGRRD